MFVETSCSKQARHVTVKDHPPTGLPCYLSSGVVVIQNNLV